MNQARERLIIALDGMDQKTALSLVTATRSYAQTFKVGLSLFMAHGPSIVTEIRALGAEVFLDLKFYDIPMQVAKAVELALQLSPRFLTVHALGGANMLKEVVRISRGCATKILAVTILTSYSEADFNALGFTSDLNHHVVRLAEQSLEAGVDGIVSSPLELSALRSSIGKDALLVCPGIRPLQDQLLDQARVVSPYNAIQQGADFLVIGRPITHAAHSLEAARIIHQQIASALTDYSYET